MKEQGNKLEQYSPYIHNVCYFSLFLEMDNFFFFFKLSFGYCSICADARDDGSCCFEHLEICTGRNTDSPPPLATHMHLNCIELITMMFLLCKPWYSEDDFVLIV